MAIKFNYQRILNNLIARHFPNLLVWKIKIIEKKIEYKAMVKSYPWGNFIFVNPKVRKNYSINPLKALFLHELCHFEIFRKNGWGWIRINWDYLHYILSKEYNESVEAEVGKMVIKKGYKKQRDLSHKIKLR